MPIDWKNKVVFIHIPKCGGTSIERRYGLNQPENLYEENFNAFQINGVYFAPQHFTWDIIVSKYPEAADFVSYAIVRHPLEKLVSEYFYLMKRLYKRPVIKFSEWRFLIWVLVSKKKRDHLLSQTDFIGPNTRVIPLDKLDETVPELDALHKYPLDNSYSPINKGVQNSRNLASDLTRLTKVVCLLKYRRDYKLLKDFFHHDLFLTDQ